MSKALGATTIAKCRENQHGITNEWRILENKVEQLIDQNRQDESGESLFKNIKTHIAQDIAANKLIQEQVAASKEIIPFAIKSSKTHLLLDKAQELTNEYGDNIENLIKEWGTNGRNIMTDELPNSANKLGWGSTDSLFYSATLLETYFALSGTNINDYTNSTSAISHLYPLPSSIDIASNYSLGYSSNGKHGLALIGSYQFGGSRITKDLPPILPKKLINAHDCTSAFEEFNNHQNDTMITMYQVGLYKNYNNSTFTLDEPTLALRKIYDVNLKPEVGSLYVTRTFKGENNPDNSFGIGGHSMVITKVDNQSITGVGYYRDIEGKNNEGFGIQEYPNIENSKIQDAQYNENNKEPKSTLQFYLTNKPDHNVIIPSYLNEYINSPEFQSLDHIDPNPIVKLYDQYLIGQNLHYAEISWL